MTSWSPESAVETGKPYVALVRPDGSEYPIRRVWDGTHWDVWRQCVVGYDVIFRRVQRGVFDRFRIYNRTDQLLCERALPQLVYGNGGDIILNDLHIFLTPKSSQERPPS